MSPIFSPSELIIVVFNKPKSNIKIGNSIGAIAMKDFRYKAIIKAILIDKLFIFFKLKNDNKLPAKKYDVKR